MRNGMSQYGVCIGIVAILNHRMGRKQSRRSQPFSSAEVIYRQAKAMTGVVAWGYAWAIAGQYSPRLFQM
jgi:hypothetical protein